jgi:hypothetical protein
MSALPAEADAMTTEQKCPSNKYHLFVQRKSKRLMKPFTGLRRMCETDQQEHPVLNFIFPE